MTLATRTQELATRVATEIKSVRTLVNGNMPDLSALDTSNKTSIVAAINEVNEALSVLAGGAAGISDSSTSASTTWSSQKITDMLATVRSDLLSGAPAALDTLDELAAALGDDANFASTVTTALGNRVRVDAAQSLTGPQQAQARENIGAGTSNVVIGTAAGQAADAAAMTTALAGKAAASHTHATADVTGLDAALAGKAAASHTHTAANITDSTAVGRSVLTAADAAAARSAIGAGTGSSNLVIGTTAGTAADAAAVNTALAGKAATTHSHTASQISDATTVGRSVLMAADAAAARTAIGAGTSSVVIGTGSGQAADAAVVNAALAARVRTDTAAQGLTAQQMTNARTNIGAVGTAEIGDPETNLVAVFEAGL